jgi:hypothetical protein
MPAKACWLLLLVGWRLPGRGGGAASRGELPGEENSMFSVVRTEVATTLRKPDSTCSCWCISLFSFSR